MNYTGLISSNQFYRSCKTWFQAKPFCAEAKKQWKESSKLLPWLESASNEPSGKFQCMRPCVPVVCLRQDDFRATACPLSPKADVNVPGSAPDDFTALITDHRRCARYH